MKYEERRKTPEFKKVIAAKAKIYRAKKKAEQGPIYGGPRMPISANDLDDRNELLTRRWATQ